MRLCCEAHELVLVLVSLSTESDSLEGRGGRQGRGRREEVSDPLVLVVVDKPRPVLVRSLPPCRHSIAVTPLPSCRHSILRTSSSVVTELWLALVELDFTPSISYGLILQSFVLLDSWTDGSTCRSVDLLCHCHSVVEVLRLGVCEELVLAKHGMVGSASWQ